MKKSKFKRVLALALTLLMVVGLVPLSAFAADTEATAPTSEYKTLNTFDELWDEIIERAYSGHWILAVDSNNPTMTPAYAEGGIANSSRIWGTNASNPGTDVINKAGGVISVSAAADSTVISHMIGTGFFLESNLQNAWNKNIAGLDYAFTVDINVSADSPDGYSGFGPQFSVWKTNSSAFQAVRIEVSTVEGEKVCKLYTPKSKTSTTNWDIGAGDVEQMIYEFKPGETVNVKVLYDCDITDGGTYHVYVEDEYKASVKASAGHVYSTNSIVVSHQTGWQVGDYANNAVGPHVVGLQFAAAAYSVAKFTASNVKMYCYDADGDGYVSDGDRGTAVKDFFYNSYDGPALSDGANKSGYMLTGNGTLSFEDKALKLTANTNGLADVFTFTKSGAGKWTFNADNSGKSFVYQVDVKLGEVAANINLVSFVSVYGKTDNYLAADGMKPVGLYLKSNGEIYRDSSSTTCLGKLSADKFTTVGFEVDVENNKISVYVDGAKMVTEDFLTQTQLNKLEENKGNLPNGFSLAYVENYLNTGKANAGKHIVTFDNSFLYFGDEYIMNDINAEIDAKYFVKPTTVDQIKNAVGENNIIYYNDYNSLGDTVDKTAVTNSASYKKMSIYSFNLKSSALVVSDSDKALSLAENGAGPSKDDPSKLDYSITLSSSRTPIVDNQGKSFVYSSDFRMGADTFSAGQLFMFGSYIKNNYEAYTAIPVWVDASGALYVTNAGTNPATDIGCVSSLNARSIDTKVNGVAVKGDKIGQLSKTEFTNVTVHVKNNQFKVYIDGVDKTGWLLFMNDATDTAYAAAGTAEYAEDAGFALTHIGIYRENKNSALPDVFILDNTAVYWSDTVVGAKHQLYDGAENSGYKYENGGIYYYENGTLVTDRVSPDGIFVVDANGQVFHGKTAVTSVSDYYKALANGDIVPVNGVYKAATYQANAILGAVDGNLYYYDADGNMVVSQTGYQIGDKYYNIDATGILSLSDFAIGDDGVVEVTGKVDADNPVYFDGVKCDTLSMVLENMPEGTTFKVTEVADYSNETISFSNDVVIDLNGQTLTASGLAIFSATAIIDSSSEGTGLLNIPRGNITATNVESEDSLLIYKEDEDDTKSGYIMAKVTRQDTRLDDTAYAKADSFSYFFRPSFANSKEGNAALLGAGMGNAEIERLVIRLVNAGDNSKINEWECADKWIQDAYKNNKALKFTVRNIDAEKYADGIRVECIIYTASGMSCTITADSVYTPTV